MIKPIVTDTFLLQQKSSPAQATDQQIIRDLYDTLAAHQDHCVGMAANMIGSSKRIIIVQPGPLPFVLVNPTIKKRQGLYTTSEGCLSLPGTRSTTRYQTITVTYQDQNFHPHTETFTGAMAQIIQHELDHCEGILI